MTIDVPYAQFLERTSAAAALMPAWFNGFPLAAIDPSAVPASPGEL
jgi:hypothetical protein